MESTNHDPFAILELPVGATPMEIERQKQKLLGMLQLNLKAAAVYHSPEGQKERTEDSVRWAARQLADGSARAKWELWNPNPEQFPEAAQAIIRLNECSRQVAAGLPLTMEEFDCVGEGFDAMFAHGGFFEPLYARADEDNDGDKLDDIDQLCAEFEEEVEKRLCKLLPENCSVDDFNSEFAKCAVERRDAPVLEALQLAFERLLTTPPLSNRARQEFCGFKKHYDQVVAFRDSFFCYNAFHIIYIDMVDWGLEYYNSQDFEFAAEVFGWMREHARKIDDREAYKLCADNALAAVESSVAVKERDYRGAGWGVFVAIILIAKIVTCASRQQSNSYDDYADPNLQLNQRLFELRQRNYEQPTPDFPPAVAPALESATTPSIAP